jgi:hypothetical protein
MEIVSTCEVMQSIDLIQHTLLRCHSCNEKVHLSAFYLLATSFSFFIIMFSSPHPVSGVNESVCCPFLFSTLLLFSTG